MGRCPEEVSEPAARQVGERASERVSAPVLSPRSVVFRAEIGPVPARDRSKPVPRSVRFRVEIGPRSFRTSRLTFLRESDGTTSEAIPERSSQGGGLSECERHKSALCRVTE